MNANSLIPYSEALPVPAEIFIVLEQLFFLIHILLVNSIVGLALIILFKGRQKESISLLNPFAKKIPILFALGINMAIPALLFLQVVFGSLFYTSSIFMGSFWILIIPFLIIAYYSSYYYYKKFDTSNYSRHALLLILILVFYIAFMLVNNLSMMEMPDKWIAYFEKRDGTILLWNVPSIYPRFLHFLVASIAVGGIIYAFYFNKKGNKEKTKEGLKIFAYATMIQIVVGVWFLLSHPNEIMLKFMGKDAFATAVLIIGITTALVSIVTAIKGNLKGTILFLLLTLIAMIINRYNLRIFYLTDKFSPSQLELVPQWDVFAIFVVILMLGVGVIIYMLKIEFRKEVVR
ncbi:hypothetical protein [Thermodesulfovibrio hydrogeniphilus]